MENKMFCYQCQETAGCAGCTKSGVCGKGAPYGRFTGYAGVGDKRTFRSGGTHAGGESERSDGVNSQVVENLFITITNANFDDEAIIRKIKETLEMKKSSQKACQERNPCLQRLSGMTRSIWKKAKKRRCVIHGR